MVAEKSGLIRLDRLGIIFWDSLKDRLPNTLENTPKDTLRSTPEDMPAGRLWNSHVDTLKGYRSLDWTYQY